jgi:hypothetical protein
MMPISHEQCSVPVRQITLTPQSASNSSVLIRAPRFLERSITVAALLCLPGILLVAAGVILGDVAGTLIAALGAIIITVALLSVLYDAYLKDVLLGEIYDAMGVAEYVRTLDFQQIARNDQLDVEALVRDTSHITALPLDPLTWMNTQWRILMDRAATSAVDIAVLLPSHDSPHIDVLAERFEVDSETLVKQIADLPDRLGRSWDGKGQALAGSSFRVTLYDTVPTAGLLVTDQSMTIEVPPALSNAAGDRSAVALVFGRKGTSSLITTIVDDQLAPARIPGYSQSVMRPIPADVSPDPPPKPSTPPDAPDTPLASSS